MKPQSFSATALHVAGLCLARYRTQYLGKMPEGGRKTAAAMGSAVHGALELFVKATQLDRTHLWENVSYLELCYKTSYTEVFNSTDWDTPEYIEGWELTLKWHAQQDWSNKQVLSLETKENFPIPTSIGDIPFNYIFDRLDKLTDCDEEYQVVDYKTSKWNITQDELRKKIQARAYALACRIKYPNAKRIWVEFDMLRHDRIAVSYSRDDNIKFYRWLQRETERIINTSDSDAPETLNEECRFCPRKARCVALRKNIGAGGIHSITPEEAASMLGDIQAQQTALKDLGSELERILLIEAAEQDSLALEYPESVVSVYSRKQRKTDNSAIMDAIGPEIAKRYGKITLGDIDDLLKGNELDADQKMAVRAAITNDFSDPRVKIKKPDPLKEDLV